jgi:hypothetical protein
MTKRQKGYGLKRLFWLALAVTAPVGMAHAQVRTVDPNAGIDSDLAPGAPAANHAPAPAPASASSSSEPVAQSSAPANASGTASAGAAHSGERVPGQTYKKDDVIGAAEGVFGKGAEGLAGIVEKILKDQGEPIAYISGREAAAAVGIGLRYGSGTMNHKIEGERAVYWTGPSVGFDLGGNAAKTFVLVYNLYDSQNLYKRYPAGEGAVYVVGGFTASYLRRGDVVLIPIRLGVGWRLGINAGYMKFSEHRRIIPF